MCMLLILWKLLPYFKENVPDKIKVNIACFGFVGYYSVAYILFVCIVSLREY